MPQKPSVKYALIALMITAVWMIVEHVAGWNTTRHDIGEYTRMIPMALFWVMIFVTVNQSRGGRSPYTFSEGLRDGLMMSLLYCAGFTVLIFLYQTFLNPEFFETFKAYKLSQLEAAHATQAEIDSMSKNMEMSFNGSVASYLLLFVFSFGWGFILSAVAALVYRKK